MSEHHDLVIDADVMRAAGTSETPHASNARRALEAIREGGHRMVLSRPLIDEYKKHASRYASTWRSNMISRKLHRPSEHLEDTALRKTVADAQPHDAPAKETAALKDIHLLEIAFATDGRIISKDAKARDLFRRACPNLGHHKNILWGDLTGLPEAVIAWLREGCRQRNDFRLCPAAPVKRT